jgi:hypothetical protein
MPRGIERLNEQVRRIWRGFMATVPLKERVAILEKEVERLRSDLEKMASADKPWWDQIIGTFADDPAFEEAVRLGREYRESQRPRQARFRKP